MFFLFFLALLPYFFGPSTGAVLPRDPSLPPSIIREQQFISPTSPDDRLPPLITLEEHFISPALEPEVSRYPQFFLERLPDMDKLRLKEMDEGQIVKQFISLVPLPVNLSLCQDANDFLAEAIKSHPSRYGGWAAVPMEDSAAAADELTRAVKQLNFVGTLIGNHHKGKFYDNKTYWPLFARAEELNVPVYLHPANPAEEWKPGFEGNYPDSVAFNIGTSGWDWHQQIGIHILRLFNAGFFDKFRSIKLILGHMGEMLPFQLDRIIDQADTTGGWPKRERDLRTVWNTNIWITTSGMFSTTPFASLVRQMPVDRILYSVDWPYSNNTQGVAFMKELRKSGLVTEEQFEGIAYKNAQSLLSVRV